MLPKATVIAAAVARIGQAPLSPGHTEEIRMPHAAGKITSDLVDKRSIEV
jgi:hypothetical protein